MTRPAGRAAFLDRDGTIVEEAHYLDDPDQVALIPGAAAALRRLERAGFLTVLVTNQSGIARGLYTEQQFRAVQGRVAELLARDGARLGAVYHCPHHPDHTGPCDCRKPDLGMYRRAALEHGLDLASSIYVGDKLTDVVPALRTGGRGFLVRTGYGVAEAEDAPAGIHVVADLGAVAAAVDTLPGAE
ncbi:MAG: HAD family hydrolase [Gemmatimonadota bacterium]